MAFIQLEFLKVLILNVQRYEIMLIRQVFVAKNNKKEAATTVRATVSGMHGVGLPACRGTEWEDGVFALRVVQQGVCCLVCGDCGAPRKVIGKKILRF